MIQNNMEVVAYAEVIDGKVVSVRLDKSRHCTEPIVTLTSAQAEIVVQKQANEALMRERANIIETKREQLARLTARAEAAEKERDALREFAESFRVSVNEASFYKDVALHLISPHSLSLRIGNDSSKSWLFKDLEDRRKAALQPLEPKND